jgi:plastocyanin
MKTLRKLFRLMVISAGVAFFGHALPGFAATFIVNVGNTNLSGTAADVFVPATNNVNVNDQVVWNWVGSHHSSTSGTNGVPGDDNGVPSGLWDSGVNNAPNSFTNTFTSAGAFSFYCSIHFSIGMRGLINVAASTPSPIVISGAVFTPPSDFQFSYTANTGLSYIVQESSDLMNWTTLGTNVAAESPVLFDDPNATNNTGFYRVGLLPGP